MQEERFSLGENSNRMVTVTPFNANLKVHIRQFYVSENGEMKASRIGVTLSVEELNELVKLIPKIQDSIAQYKLQDIGPSPPPRLPVLPPPLIDLEKILTDLSPKEKVVRYHPDLAADEYLYGPTIDRETRITEHDNPVSTLSKPGKSNSLCKDETETGLLEKHKSFPAALEINDSEFEGVPCIYKPTNKRQKRKTVHSQKKSNRKSFKDKSPRTIEKDGKTPNKEINFVNNGKRKMINDCDHKCPKAVGFSDPGAVLHCSECKSEKKKRKYECIDEVDSVESMKEVERKLWLTHYNMLSEKLMEVVREKCIGCQMNEPNQLGHELCLMSSSEEQVNLCFGEVYKCVIWDKVLDNWYKKVLEMPINLNPETLAIFRETVNPKDFTYKNRLRKWLIESPTIEL